MSGFEFVENVNFVLITFTGSLSVFFFFNDTATTEIYTLSLHDALPIFPIRFVEGMLLSGLIPVAMSMVGDTIPFEKRSEEHTSELQSQSNLVCRLLLEKKTRQC